MFCLYVCVPCVCLVLRTWCQIHVTGLWAAMWVLEARFSLKEQLVPLITEPSLQLLSFLSEKRLTLMRNCWTSCRAAWEFSCFSRSSRIHLVYARNHMLSWEIRNCLQIFKFCSLNPYRMSLWYLSLCSIEIHGLIILILFLFCFLIQGFSV